MPGRLFKCVCVYVCVHGATACSSSRESDKYVEKWEPVYDFYFYIPTRATDATMRACVSAERMPGSRLYTSAGFGCFFLLGPDDRESVVVTLQSNNKAMIHTLTCRPGRRFISSSHNVDTPGKYF